MKIKIKVILFFLIICFSILTLITSINYIVTKNTINEIVLNNLNSIALIQKNQILFNIENNFDKLHLIKNRLGLRTNLEKYLNNPVSEYEKNVSDVLKDSVYSINSFKKIMIADLSGKIIFSTDKTLINTNFSKNGAFVRALKEDSIDNFFIDKNNSPSVYSTGLITKNINYAGKELNNNEKLGVLFIETPLEELLPINHEFTGLGKTGEVTSAKLMDNGEVIAISPLRFMPDSFLKLKIPLSRTDRPIIRAIKGEENIFTDMVNYRNKKILTVTRYIPNTKWGITVNIDQDEVYAPLYNLQRIIIILFIITSILIIFISLYLANLITKPIIYMTNVAMKISKGNYSEKVIINSKDEIGMLAEALNNMSDSFIKYNQDLQEEIVLRVNTEAEMEKFAYVSAHDLQEPLRSITSFTQLLEKKYKNSLNSEGKKYIDTIINASKLMKEQINDLLVFSKLSYEKKNFKQIDFNKILGYVITGLKSEIEETNTKITYSNLPTVSVNYLLIIQLFENLISNAIKYKRNENPIISINAIKQDKYWIFSIKDNGIGIDEKYYDKIFEIFKRLHTRDKYSGTGLGLSICRKIIEIHDGKIWVESQVGVGSTFFFLIPE